MAAPSTAYTHKIPLEIFNIKDEVQLCAKLEEYENQIKQLFYLDGIVTLKNSTEVNFVGIVFVGGFNYYMRKPELIGKAKLEKYVNQKFVILKDSINTYPYLLAGMGYKLEEPPIANMTLKSAYFSDTSDYGYQLKINSGTTQTISYGFLGKQLEDVGYKELPAVVGDFVELRGYATNDQGTVFGDWYSARVRPTNYSFRYSRVDNGNGTATYTVNVFPIPLEIALSVVFRQWYSGSGTITYLTVTVPAGQTTGSGTMTLEGSPIGYAVNNWTPIQTSDLTPINDGGEASLKYRVKLKLVQEWENEYFLYITVTDDVGAYAELPSPISINLYITGNTEFGAYGEYFTISNVWGDDERLIYLSYDATATLWNRGMSATATPTSVDGKEVVFTYEV